MDKIIKGYCDDNSFNNGLLLIDTPTGFGKTHDVLEYIFNASIDEKNEGKKFFFVTTLKKNLPQKELRDRFIKAGYESQFNEKFLFIDSNADAAISGYSKDLIKKVPAELNRTDEFKIFKTTVEFLTNKQQGKMSLPIMNYFRQDVEPKFRRCIQKELATQFKTVDERIKAIVLDPKWQWVGNLYPAVFTRNRQIIFMSMDKFLNQNSTIVEPSYMLYNSKLLDNACVFIDEFDATKETILKNIINEGLQERIDVIDLFRNIHSSLENDVFPAVLTTPSNDRLAGSFSDCPLQEVIDRTKEVAESIFNDYSLQFNHKTSEDVVDNNRNFIFQDHQYHSLFNGNKGFPTAFPNKKSKVNEICFKNNPKDDDGNINKMLGRMRGFISFFQKAVNILSINYMQLKRDRRQDGEDEFSYESAIKSVLSLFHLPEQYSDYITKQVLISSHRKDCIEGPEYDLSFYEKGFRYYAFEDDSIHDMQSKIMMYSFQKTPEKILLRFCEKAKVVGLSATGRIPTIIGNYDLTYLRLKLKSLFKEISSAEVERLEKRYRQSIKGYSDVKINVQSFEISNGEQYSKDCWNSIFSDNELIDNVYETIERSLSEKSDAYAKERYWRIAFAYKEFLKHDDIKSFLCVLTKHPRLGDKQLDLDLLRRIFELISKENNCTFDKNTIVQLDGDEYDSKKDAIIKRLGDGEKLFVISVYQTIGAGQNLQYPIPNLLKERLVRINDYGNKDEKDFDAIYLDQPTNILVNLGKDLDEENFIKYLFQVEFLQEASEISFFDAFKQIKNAFICYSTRNPGPTDAVNLYETKSVKDYATRTIIQAIGRICRTNVKNKNIYIFVDNRIFKMIDSSSVNKNLVNPEFKALLEKNKFVMNHDLMSELENKASLLSVRVNKEILNMIDNEWTKEKMEKWKKLREMVLKHPTISEVETTEDSFKYQNFYVNLPAKADHYYYTQESDYNNIRVYFSGEGENMQTVSSESARLNQMLELPRVKDYFERKGWATQFEKNDYIMSPALFNNIYKGALGEFVGRIILWNEQKIDLEEIEEERVFELFDFSVKNKPGIYVDFKNWKETTTADEKMMIEKISRKAKKCNAKAVIIINVFSVKKYSSRRKTIDGLNILIVPSLAYGNQNLAINDSAIYEIKRCIDEISD